MGIVDTGGGYASQGVTPVHIGLGEHVEVDLEVTTPGKNGRITTRLGVRATGTLPGAPVTVAVGGR
jgi:hypothetical protein